MKKLLALWSENQRRKIFKITWNTFAGKQYTYKDEVVQDYNK